MSCALQITKQENNWAGHFLSSLSWLLLAGSTVDVFHLQHNGFWEYVTFIYSVEALYFMTLLSLQQLWTHVGFWVGLIITRKCHSKISMKAAQAFRLKKNNHNLSVLSPWMESLWQFRLGYFRPVQNLLVFGHACPTHLIFVKIPTQRIKSAELWQKRALSMT